MTVFLPQRLIGTGAGGAGPSGHGQRATEPGRRCGPRRPFGGAAVPESPSGHDLADLDPSGSGSSRRPFGAGANRAGPSGSVPGAGFFVLAPLRGVLRGVAGHGRPSGSVLFGRMRQSLRQRGGSSGLARAAGSFGIGVVRWGPSGPWCRRRSLRADVVRRGGPSGLHRQWRGPSGSLRKPWRSSGRSGRTAKPSGDAVQEGVREHPFGCDARTASEHLTPSSFSIPQNERRDPAPMALNPVVSVS